MTKQIKFIALAAVLLLACPRVEALTVCCTTFPLYLFTLNIVRGAKGVATELVFPPSTGCPHDYALTPRDLKKMSAPGMILVMNGCKLDDFILRTLSKTNPNAHIIVATDGIKPLADSGKHCGGHQGECGHEHGHEHDGGNINPHMFASPFEAVQMVKNIAAGLAKNDPANAKTYLANCRDYTVKLEKLCAEFAAASKRFKHRKIAAQHEAFDYLMKRLGLEVPVFVKSAPGGALTANDMIELAKRIKASGVRVIYTEPQYPARASKALARECGISVAELDPVACGPENPPYDHYEKTMRKNIKTLQETLGK